jgi:hypothetical protein
VDLLSQLLQWLAAPNPVPRSLPNRWQAGYAAMTPPAWSLIVALRRISNRRPLPSGPSLFFSAARPDGVASPALPPHFRN